MSDATRSRGRKELRAGAGVAEASSPDGSSETLDSAERLASRVQALEAEVRQLRRKLAQSEEALSHGEKLQALGQLISGVAHELANPLTAIIARAALISTADTVEDARRHAVSVEEQGQRATKIVRSLSSLARRRAEAHSLVSLNDVVRAVIDVHGYQLAEGNIDVVQELDPELPEVTGDPHQLEQVLLNLITNAHWAMVHAHGRGRLSIHTCARDEVVRLVVADDGPGIPPHVLAHAFEPFFSTKGEEGTGLGLAICRDLVTAHGGRIMVESTDGTGTTMVMELPRFRGSGPLPLVEAAPMTHTPGVRRRILVVDDEPDIAELIAHLLVRRGYDAEDVHSGAAALTRLRAQEFDGIVTDVRMPGMTGEELWQTLRREAPALARRTIFMTGNHADPAITAMLEATGQPFLTKPFGADELVDAVAMLQR